MIQLAAGSLAGHLIGNYDLKSFFFSKFMGGYFPKIWYFCPYLIFDTFPPRYSENSPLFSHYSTSSLLYSCFFHKIFFSPTSQYLIFLPPFAIISYQIMSLRILRSCNFQKQNIGWGGGEFLILITQLLNCRAGVGSRKFVTNSISFRNSRNYILFM